MKNSDVKSSVDHSQIMTTKYVIDTLRLALPGRAFACVMDEVRDFPEEANIVITSSSVRHVPKGQSRMQWLK